MRRFTPDEANALLPRLRRDFRRIHELITLARAKAREKELIKAVGYRDDGTLIMMPDYQEAQFELEQAVREVDSLVEKIHSEGMQIKDLERGLVDFPAVIHGQDVLLCWELGEPAVTYYHDYSSGYMGRKKLPADWRLE